MKWSPAVAFFTHYHHSWIRTPPPDPPPQSSSTISLSSGYQQKSVLLTPIADTYYLAHTHTTALAFRAPTATPHLYSRVHRSHSIAVNTLETLWYLSKAKEPHFSFGHHLMLLSDMTIKYISRRHSGVVLCCVVFLVSYHLVLDQTGRLCRLWCLSCFVFFTPPHPFNRSRILNLFQMKIADTAADIYHDPQLQRYRFPIWDVSSFTKNGGQVHTVS